jgi:hypothetical protein
LWLRASMEGVGIKYRDDKRAGRQAITLNGLVNEHQTANRGTCYYTDCAEQLL